jgi:hypothetical protein
MEDVALVRALGRVTRVRLLDATVTVSARRWQRDGVVRRTLANWRLLARWLLGASPERLARAYRAEPGSGGRGAQQPGRGDPDAREARGLGPRGE